MNHIQPNFFLHFSQKKDLMAVEFFIAHKNLVIKSTSSTITQFNIALDMSLTTEFDYSSTAIHHLK